MMERIYTLSNSELESLSKLARGWEGILIEKNHPMFATDVNFRQHDGAWIRVFARGESVREKFECFRIAVEPRDDAPPGQMIAPRSGKVAIGVLYRREIQESEGKDDESYVGSCPVAQFSVHPLRCMAAPNSAVVACGIVFRGLSEPDVALAIIADDFPLALRVIHDPGEIVAMASDYLETSLEATLGNEIQRKLLT